MSVVDTSPFGRGLRHWRRIRGVSQLDLAAIAATTTRHVSFLETGRSRPSRDMVDRLGDALAIPLRERNRGLLEMAGLPPGYVEGDLASHDLAPFQAVIDRLLAAHDPYPGFVLDRHWNIIQTNRASELFLASFDARNIIDLSLGAWRPLIENWTPVAGALVERLAADLLRFPDDEQLQQQHGRLRDALGAPSYLSEPSTSRVICPHFNLDGTTIRTTIAPASNPSPTSPSTRSASSSPTPKRTPTNGTLKLKMATSTLTGSSAPRPSSSLPFPRRLHVTVPSVSRGMRRRFSRQRRCRARRRTRGTVQNP